MNSKMEIYEEERPWGNFRQFTENATSTVKIISIKPNESLSLQTHEHRSEFWRVIAGSGWCEIDGIKSELKKGDEKIVEIESKHRLIASDQGMEIMEIALGQFDEKDIKRYEDKYGRV